MRECAVGFADICMKYCINDVGFCCVISSTVFNYIVSFERLAAAMNAVSSLTEELNVSLVFS